MEIPEVFCPKFEISHKLSVCIGRFLQAYFCYLICSSFVQPRQECSSRPSLHSEMYFTTLWMVHLRLVSSDLDMSSLCFDTLVAFVFWSNLALAVALALARRQNTGYRRLTCRVSRLASNTSAPLFLSVGENHRRMVSKASLWMAKCSDGLQDRQLQRPLALPYQRLLPRLSPILLPRPFMNFWSEFQ